MIRALKVAHEALEAVCSGLVNMRLNHGMQQHQQTAQVALFSETFGDGARHRLRRADTAQPLGKIKQPLRQRLTHQLQKQRLFGGKVEVGRAFGYAGLLGDARNRHRVKIRLGEKLRGRCNQLRAAQVFVLRAARALELRRRLHTMNGNVR
jgi:hypothetical protein